LGVLAEVREPAAEALPTIVAAIQEAVTRAHGVAVRDLALIDPGQLPKTSSGKVRRRASRAALADGSLPLRLRVGGPRAVPDPPPRPSPSVREDAPMPVSLMFFSSDANASASANARAGV